MWRPWAKKVHLSPDAKQIVKNVFETLNNRGYSVTDAAEETCKLTKTPISTVKDIINKPISKRKKRSDVNNTKCVDEIQKDIIRRTIYVLYQEQMIPTLDCIKKRLLKDDTGIICSRTSLWRIISQMGFKYCTINKRQVIMESYRLRMWRCHYLQAIQKYRSENLSIIYLDETWYDTHDTPTKGFVDSSGNCKTKAPSNRGQRITIIHAGSETGWVPNALLLSAKNIKDSSLDYHEDTTADLFEDWFENYLLPNIPEKSIIVMDNATYHSRQLNKVPNSNNNKWEIQEYLLKNDLYFEESYTKRDLLQVVAAFGIEKEYVCDTIAKNMGHTVLRLPPYYCMFNPIEHMWHQLKSKVRSENVSPTLNSSVIELIRNVTSNIPIDSWKNSIQHVIKVEGTYRNVNVTVAPLVINLNEDDSDTELHLD